MDPPPECEELPPLGDGRSVRRARHGHARIVEAGEPVQRTVVAFRSGRQVNGGRGDRGDDSERRQDTTKAHGSGHVSHFCGRTEIQIWVPGRTCPVVTSAIGEVSDTMTIFPVCIDMPMAAFPSVALLASAWILAL